ncbi:DUF368 domain-containing protein [Candidatus Woesearchaeota archaeon]|nr:DUF368 domain-containing protein [Candidatus Woesearchaeota archaeon]
MKDTVSLFLKGVLMGICDIIPGISGGTIAFITGIYSRLINAVKSFSLKLVIDFFNYLFRRNKESLNLLKDDIRKLDLVFLITLGIGIGAAILIGSRIISFLLKEYFVYTISFFIGLILASSKNIYDKIERHHTKNKLFGIFGLIIGVYLSLVIPANITPSFLYVFLGGFLAISAMFLPGISGAFILLILGLYKFILDALHNILDNISVFIVFGLGAGLGAFTISRIISFLFRKDRCKTLYVLLGLVVGCLSIPIKKVYESKGSWNLLSMIIVLIFLILGFLSARAVSKLDKAEV